MVPESSTVRVSTRPPNPPAVGPTHAGKQSGGKATRAPIAKTHQNEPELSDWVTVKVLTYVMVNWAGHGGSDSEASPCPESGPIAPPTRTAHCEHHWQYDEADLQAERILCLLGAADCADYSLHILLSICVNEQSTGGRKRRSMAELE